MSGRTSIYFLAPQNARVTPNRTVWVALPIVTRLVPPPSHTPDGHGSSVPAHFLAESQQSPRVIPNTPYSCEGGWQERTTPCAILGWRFPSQWWGPCARREPSSAAGCRAILLRKYRVWLCPNCTGLSHFLGGSLDILFKSCSGVRVRDVK